HRAARARARARGRRRSARSGRRARGEGGRSPARALRRAARQRDRAGEYSETRGGPHHQPILPEMNSREVHDALRYVLSSSRKVARVHETAPGATNPCRGCRMRVALGASLGSVVVVGVAAVAGAAAAVPSDYALLDGARRGQLLREGANGPTVVALQHALAA